MIGDTLDWWQLLGKLTILSTLNEGNERLVDNG